MTRTFSWLRTIGWLVHKDLLREFRARLAWLSTLLFGTLLVLMLAIQLDLPDASRQRVGGGLFWVAVFFAGALLVERSFTAERAEGCWEALASYPIAPSAIFMAKWAAIMTAMSCFESVLLPLFVVLAKIPMAEHPGAIVAVAALANAGFAAVGVLLGALTSSLRERGYLLVLLLLPLVMPVALGASEGTRLMIAGDFGETWWRWIQLLSVFATLYVASGALLFEFVTEE